MQALKQQQPLCAALNDAMTLYVVTHEFIHTIAVIISVCWFAAAWQCSRKGVGRVKPFSHGYVQNKHRRYFNPKRLAGDEI